MTLAYLTPGLLPAEQIQLGRRQGIAAPHWYLALLCVLSAEAEAHFQATSCAVVPQMENAEAAINLQVSSKEEQMFILFLINFVN